MSDYADKIAARILESQGVGPDTYRVRSGREVAELLAQAAREGYALGYAARGGK